MNTSRHPYSVWLWFLFDVGFWFFCMWVALILRFPTGIPSIELDLLFRFVPISGAGMAGSLLYAGAYRLDPLDDWKWRQIWWGWIFGVGISLAIIFILKIPYSRIAFVSGTVLYLAGIVCSRILVDLLISVVSSSSGLSILCLNFTDTSKTQVESHISDHDEVIHKDAPADDPAFEALQQLSPDIILIDGSDLSDHLLRDILDFGSRIQVPVRILPTPGQLLFSQTHTTAWDDVLILRSGLHFGLQQQLAIKELFDYVMGFIFSIIMLPVMAIIAVLIRILDGTPILYRQRRTGRGGQPFTVYKFRTMVPNADELGPELTKGPEDPRITRTGWFLRRWSLDELPQLINVLKGEMSLVGPRPELPSITEEYDQTQRRVFWLKPGLTGLSQVSGREQLELDEKLEIDQQYLMEYSVGMDLWIICKTLVAVISGTGTN